MQTYDRDVECCSAEIRDLLPQLAQKYTPLILVAALTEHVADELFQTQQRRQCTPELARAIIERLKQLALPP